VITGNAANDVRNDIQIYQATSQTQIAAKTDVYVTSVVVGVSLLNTKVKGV
jgi:hypothetical protein